MANGMRRNQRVFGTVVALLAAYGLLTDMRADSWRLPKTEKYYSQNKKYRVEVTPRAIESQLRYFEDKVEGTEPAGRPRGGALTGPRASIGVRQFLRYGRQTTFPLVNDVAPVDVAISDRGDYIVTFDDWHQMGYGDSVVVIYRSDGHVVRRFALNDLVAASDTEHFTHSVSSIMWRDGYRIDSDLSQLVIVVSSSDAELPPEWARRHELRFDLATGDALGPAPRLWPTRQPLVVADVTGDESPAAEPAPGVCGGGPVTFGSPGVIALTSRRFYDNATNRAIPVYPLIAQAARVEGLVVVELLLDAHGSVQCSRALAGPPLLRAAAVDAARQWRFVPLEETPSLLVSGRIEFRFSRQWK